MNTDQVNNLYNEAKRGAKRPDYTEAEETYRNSILNDLQMSFRIREQPHMELSDKSYSQYYLINRQQDMAYNPPKRNAADTRIASGIIHEKNRTIKSTIVDMNFQPKVRVFDKDDTELVEAAQVMTAVLKKSLTKDNFKDKLADFVHINTSQGNVFVEERRDKKYIAKKVKTNPMVKDPTKIKWKTVIEEIDKGCTSIAIPNTCVFMKNILEKDLHKQPRIWAVVHIPVTIGAQMFSHFPRWNCVPKTPSNTIPQNIDGRWGDYWLQQPADDYMELIITQSEMENDYNVFLNGVMMYPVQQEGDKITGYPLTEISPSGKFTIIKGNNEDIPFFAYGLSVPAKNEVKEETMNELLRLMIYKMRQSSKPPVGNNSERVLPANLWDPGVVTPDIRSEDLSILTPNAGITNADFSFYSLIDQSIQETSASNTVEGTSDESPTATQYIDQKKQNLKKLGLYLDNTISFLKEIYWLRLINELQYIVEGGKVYDETSEEMMEVIEDFSVEETIDGRKGKMIIKFTEDTSEYDPYELMAEEDEMQEPVRYFYVNPKYLADIAVKLRDRIFIDVVAEPEGQNQSLLAILFNMLTQYVNLKGDSRTINFEYLEKIIDQNSGFEPDKLFIKAPAIDPLMAEGVDTMQVGMVPQNTVKPAQNSILANAK